MQPGNTHLIILRLQCEKKIKFNLLNTCSNCPFNILTFEKTTENESTRS